MERRTRAAACLRQHLCDRGAEIAARSQQHALAVRRREGYAAIGYLTKHSMRENAPPPAALGKYFPDENLDEALKET